MQDQIIKVVKNENDHDQHKNRKLPQLINYKKYLNSKVKNNLNDFQKYLLAVRKNDPTQKFDSVGWKVL